MSVTDAIIDTAADVMRFYVTPKWVAEFYGVDKLRVYRAIKAQKLKAIRVRGGSLVLDTRQLPSRFPR
jgi:hypothetical protein